LSSAGWREARPPSSQFALSDLWRLGERSGCGLRAQGFAGRSPISGPDVQRRAQSSYGALARAEGFSMPVGVPRRPST
jgi:hypothetical protein